MGAPQHDGDLIQVYHEGRLGHCHRLSARDSGKDPAVSITGVSFSASTASPEEES